MKLNHLALLLLVAITSACREDVPPGFERGERRLLDVELDTAWVALSGVQDTILTFPRHAVRGADGTVYVTDRGTKVVAFDNTGTVLWSYGRAGEGPEEFRNINDIRLHEDLIYLPDVGNNRVAVINTAGEFRRYISPGASIQLTQIVRLEDGLATLTLGAGALGQETDEPGIDGVHIALLNDDGAVIGKESIPIEGNDDLPLILSQGRLSQDGDQWVFGYNLVDGWAMFEGSSSTGVVSRYIEHVPPPEVIETEGVSSRLASPGAVVCTGCSLALSDSIVYVLFGGRTPENRAVVDLYDTADGGYLGSILLPDRAYEIAVSDRQLVMLMHSPVPHVVALNMELPPLADLRANR